MSTPRTIGHYEVLELLGEGGIGQVHRGTDTVLGREVAIKSLRPELLNDASFVERFRIEATNLARLNHPNITTVYALLQSGKQLYMVMELVRGRTLEALLQDRHAFAPDEAVAIVSQAAEGLAYAHDVGIIHRDIKPANLIITDSGIVKIMDFGIARFQGSQRLTRDGSIIGTLAYMAPEQLRAEEVDARTDLYSLAIVFYEMLSGSVPFTAQSDYDLMRAQIHTTPERLKHRVAGLDSQIEKALMRALAKKPSDRFSSVAAFKEALGAAAPRPRTEQLAQQVARPSSVSAAPDATMVLTPRTRTPMSPLFRGFAIGTTAVAAAGVMGFVVHQITQLPPISTTSVTPPPLSRLPTPSPAVEPKSADTGIGLTESASREASAPVKETLASTSQTTSNSLSASPPAQPSSASVTSSPSTDASIASSPPVSLPPAPATISSDRAIGSDEIARRSMTVAATPPSSNSPMENPTAKSPVASVPDEEGESELSKHKRRTTSHGRLGASEQPAPHIRATPPPRQAQQDHGSSASHIGGVGF